jgi:hypothetical protein
MAAAAAALGIVREFQPADAEEDRVRIESTSATFAPLGVPPL